MSTRGVRNPHLTYSLTLRQAISRKVTVQGRMMISGGPCFREKERTGGEQEEEEQEYDRWGYWTDAGEGRIAWRK